MNNTIRPLNEEELAATICEARAKKRPLELIGHGTKRNIGRPLEARPVTMERMRGVTLYRPSEMVISALAGTPISVIEHRLTHENQELAFEPVDYGPLLGQEAGQGTIGAVIAANLSGPRRIRSGAARDHLLGITAINGRGEQIKSGGRVMKNVTGYDLCKGIAGSWGTLAAITEVTMKLIPRAQGSATLFLTGLGDEVGVNTLCKAMDTPFEVSGTVHIQDRLTPLLSDEELRGCGRAITAVRLENFKSSVTYRLEELKKSLAAFGQINVLEEPRSVRNKVAEPCARGSRPSAHRTQIYRRFHE